MTPKLTSKLFPDAELFLLPPKTKRLLVGAVLALLAGSLLLYIFRNQALPAASALLALATIWVGITPGFLFVAIAEDRRPLLPMVALIGLYFAVYFGFSVFVSHILGNHGSQDLDYQIIVYAQASERAFSIQSQLLILLGLLIFYCAYFASEKLLWRRLPKLTFPNVSSDNWTAYILAILSVMFAGYQYSPSVQSIPSLGQIIQPIGYLCFGGLYYLWKKQRINRWLALFVLFIVFPLAWINLIIGLLITPIVLFILFYLMIRFWVIKSIPMAPLIIVPVLILLIYPLLPQIRGLNWPGSMMNNLEGTLAQSKIEKMKTFIETIIYKDKYGNLNTDIGDRIKLRYRGLVQRITHTAVFTFLVDHTPNDVPFLAGSSYKPLITSVIPRSIWPGKPEERFGGEFGQRYGFIDKKDTNSSVNVPWITEMYVNFGTSGVIGGMLILGFVLSGLVQYLANWAAPPLEQIAGAAILFPLFYQDSNLSLMVGSIPWQVVGIWALFYVAFKLPIGLSPGVQNR